MHKQLDNGLQLWHALCKVLPLAQHWEPFMWSFSAQEFMVLTCTTSVLAQRSCTVSIIHAYSITAADLPTSCHQSRAELTAYSDQQRV